MASTKVTEVLEKLKGKGNEDKTLTNKAAFSEPLFSELVHAIANDPEYKFKSVDRDGNVNEVNVSNLIRSDLKKTVEAAKCPQKPELSVLDTAEISTKGLSTAIRASVTEWLRTGRKFTVPAQPDFNGDVFLTKVPGKTSVHKVRDMKTGEDQGTTEITTKDHVQVRVKSSAPKNLVTKVRKDKTGKVIG